MMMIDRLVQQLGALDCNTSIARIKHTTEPRARDGGHD